jgi:uncharacterized UBP type Zn finger protein
MDRYIVLYISLGPSPLKLDLSRCAYQDQMFNNMFFCLPIMTQKDVHLKQVNQNISAKTPNGCEECLKISSDWVQLRLCLTCGHVGCCDSSRNKHATKHFQTTDHPIIKSFEPGENWEWCYVDKTYVA